MGKINIKMYAKEHASGIFKCVGVGCLIGACATAIWATPKAVDLLREKQIREQKGKLSVLDIFKTTWKLYLPTVTLIAAGVGCIVKSNNIDKKKNAALIATTALAQQTYNEYRDSVIETLGNKKEKAVRDNIAKKKVEKTEIDDKTIIITGKGNTLFMDSMSNQIFKSDIDTIRKSINILNTRLINDNYISLDDVYRELGIGSTKLSPTLGWQVGELIEVDFIPELKNDEAIIVIDFLPMPKPNYARFA